MSEGLPFPSCRRSRLPVVLLLASIASTLAHGAHAQTPPFHSFDTRFAAGGFDETISWSVAGITNVEQFLLLPPAASYRGDPPAFGKSIRLTADLIVNDTTPVAGACADFEYHTLTLYGYNLEYIDSDTFTCKPGQPCPSDGASEHLTTSGDFTFWPVPSGATLAAIDYWVTGGCRPERRAVVTLVASWDTAFWRSDPQQNGGPDAKPFVLFANARGGCDGAMDDPDGGGCGGAGGSPPTPEDCPDGTCEQCPEGMTCDPGEFGQCPAVTINGCPRPSGPNTCSGGTARYSQGLPGYWIDTALVMPVIKDTDFVMVGNGPAVRMTRTWTTLDAGASMFGPNWSFSYDAWLEGGFCGPAVVWTGRGGGRRFTPPAGVTCDNPPVGQTLTYVATAGHRDVLTYTRDTPVSEHFDFDDATSGYRYRFEYFSGGGFRLASITDRSGATLTIARNADTTIARVTDASDQVTTFGYDANKRCISMTTADGLVARYTYDASGRLATATDLLGTVTAFTYDGANHVTGVSAGGRGVSFLYGASSGRSALAGLSEDGGVNWTTIAPPFAGAGQQSLLVTSPAGRTRQFTTRDGNTVAVADVIGTTTFDYDGDRRPVRITRPDATFVTYLYDAAGNLQRFVDAAGRQTTYTHDAARRILTKTDNAAGRWEYGWDQHDALTSVKSPGGRVTLYTRDTRGRVTSASEGGRGLTLSYDAAGNVATITSPAGHRSDFNYDARGNLTGYTDPLGAERRYEYDANRRLTTLIEPDGTVHRLTYDACASTGVVDANGHATTTEVNASLYATAITDAAGRGIARAFDRDNRLTRQTEAGVTTLFGYDAAGRVTSQARDGATFRFTLDALGRPVAVTDPRGKTTETTYDAAGNWLTRTDPDGHTRTVTRDALGRVHTATNARGQMLTYTYDADGFLLTTVQGTTTLSAFVREPASGRVTRFTDATGETTLTWDTAAQLTRIRRPHGEQLDVTYNAVGQVSQFTYAGGFVVTRSYDANGRLARVAWPGGFVRLSYDAAGRLVSEQRSNGTETRHTLDAGDAVTRLEHSSGGTPFARVSLARDSGGRITEESRMVPDAPVVAPLSSSTATFGNSNDVMVGGGSTYAYDADGNLVTITGARAWNATFDADNRLTTLQRDAEQRAFTYDARGARVATEVNGVLRREFRSPAGNLLWESNAAGGILAYYIYAGTRLVARVAPDGASYFYHPDARGSTLAITDGTGAVVNAYAYGPFGEITRRREAIANRFTYVGAEGVEEEGDGLYFMRHRYYDARDGRFITRDPIGFSGGFNLYGYVGGDLPNSTDASGLGPPKPRDPKQEALKCLVVVSNGAEAMLSLGAAAVFGGPVGVVAVVLAVDDLVTAFRYAGGKTSKTYQSASEVVDDVMMPGGDGREALTTWIYRLFVPAPIDFGEGDAGLVTNKVRNERDSPDWE